MLLADVIIILFILMGAVVGFKRGLTTELISTLGIIIIIVISFLLKNPVSQVLYSFLPFFKFGGFIKGVTVLNILVYEIIAFLLVLALLTIVFKLVLSFTKIFEKLLKYTIILGIPSKIAGAVVGLIENYIWVFIILYVITLPFFNLNFDSKYKDKILGNTPLLSKYIDSSIKVVDEFADLKEKYEVTTNAAEFNRETLDLFLKYNIVTVESVEELIKKDKLSISNVDEILNKYKEK